MLDGRGTQMLARGVWHPNMYKGARILIMMQDSLHSLIFAWGIVTKFWRVRR